MPPKLTPLVTFVMAWLHLHLGDTAAAIASLREATDIRRKVLGEYHPEYALALNNLASLLTTMGRGSEAIPLLTGWSFVCSVV